MVIDNDVEKFFKIIDLDWRNFSFDELIQKYEALLVSIYKGGKFDIELLTFYISTFSDIMMQFYECKQVNIFDVADFFNEKVYSLRGLRNYDTRQTIIALSMVFAHNLLNSSKEIDFFSDEMYISFRLHLNVYYIEKTYESVDKKFEDIQKGIGVIPS